MTVDISNCEQGTPEWFSIRSGMPTASEFSTVMAKGKGGGDSITRRKYLYTLAAEIITGEVAESYSNSHMERGKALEPEARAMYEFLSSDPVSQVGFIRDSDKGAGCSPDSLVGNTGMLEIKTKLPALLLESMFRDDFPPEHKAQCQGALWVADREWIDLAVYWPGLPLVLHRANRDDVYIRTMEKAIAEFNDELAKTVERVRQYGAPPVNILSAG